MTSNAASLDLALIGNCAISALVDKRGAIVWCCAPRFDGDPIFHSLLGSADGAQQDGVFGVELEGFARSEQAYDPSTAVVRTRLFDAAGEGIEIVDFCPRFLNRDRSFRPAQIVRRVRPLVGHPRVRFIVRPRGQWGTAAPEITRGSNHLRFILPGGVLRLNTNAPADLRPRQHLVLAAGPGEPAARPGRDAVGRDRGNLARLRGADGAVLASLDPAPGRAARVAGRGDPLGDHAQAVPVRGDRRDRRGDDDQHPGGAEHRAQLGLSLLLAARRLLRRQGAEQPLGSRHDGRLPALAQRRRAQRRRRACPAAVRHRPREDPHREPGADAARLSRHGSGARRQPGLRALPARRVRQHRPRRIAGVLRPSAVPPRRPARFRRARRHGRAGLALPRPARCRDVGAAHARARAHLVVADVLGRVRPARQDRRGPRAGREPGDLAQPRRHDPRQDPRAVVERAAGRPSSRASAARTSTRAFC